MKQKSKCIIKSIITFVLTVIMVLGAVPLPFAPGSMVVHAAGGDGTSPETAIELDGTGAEETAWKNMRAVFNNASSIKRSDESADNPTYYKLTTDFTANQNELGEQIVVGSDRFVVLDLNGHTLNRNCNDSMRSRGSQGMVIIICGELTLTDSVGEGKITGGYDLRNFDGDAGAGVLIDSGKFTMNGGTICGNTAQYGGGVHVDSECEFTMNGGTIMGNSATTNGGGVYVDGNGMFNMNGGTICGNTARCGGGVYIGASGGAGRFVMSGGTITGNNCSGSSPNGGGVFLQYTCICEISGSPVIRDNYKQGTLADGVYVKGTDGIDNNLYRLQMGSSDKVTTITGILQEGAEIHGIINYDSRTCEPIAQYDESYVPSTEVMKADVNRFYCDNESTFVRGLYDNKIYFRKPLTDSDVTISTESFTYNGEEQTPTITVKDGDEIITTDSSEDKYYVLTYDTEDNSDVTFKDAGDYTVIISGPRYYYVKENALTIEPKPVTITGLSASGKVYDGSTEATVTGTATIDGKVGNDDVSVSFGSANFADANAGTDKVVIFNGYSLTGDDAGNYTLSAQPANVTANITLKDVTVTAKAQSVEVGGSIATGTAWAELSGALTDHTLSEITLTGDTSAVTNNGTITPSVATINDAFGNDVTDNYNITYESGTLTVTGSEIITTIINHGTVISKVNGTAVVAAPSGSTVTLIVTPDKGYKLKSLTVMQGETPIAVENNQFIMPDGNVTVSAEFTRVYDDGIGEHLAGHSLSLNGNIGVNFYMELDADVIADPDAYMLFTLPNGTTQDVKIDQATTKTISGKTYYVFQCNVAAKEMTDTITAQMFSGDKSGQVYEYTVKDYADYLFANAYEDDGTTVKNQDYVDAIPLVKAMLNYGSYSQTYFSHNTDALANAGITDTDVSAVTDETVSKPYDNSTAILPSGITLAGANLELESETVMNLYFTNTTGKALTFTTSGNVALVQEQSGEYTKVTITGIAAQYLDSDVTVNVALEGDDTAYSVKYSPMNYCYNVLARETTATRTEALKDVMRAFYLYNKEAKAYFASHNN